jgi:hypothetical protein
MAYSRAITTTNARMWKNRNPCALLVAMQISITLMEINIPQKAKGRTAT